MRLDKFLKVSRLIKRRSVASDACSAGRVSVNGSPRKPSFKVEKGDKIEISFGTRLVKVEVVSTAESKNKGEEEKLYRFL